MADTKTLNLRVDADLKHQAETIFANLGIPTSTAINRCPLWRYPVRFAYFS